MKLWTSNRRAIQEARDEAGWAVQASKEAMDVSGAALKECESIRFDLLILSLAFALLAIAVIRITSKNGA